MITRKNFYHNDLSNLSLVLNDMISRFCDLEDYNDDDENMTLLILATYRSLCHYMETKFNG